MRKILIPLLALASGAGASALAAPLSIKVYNPQDKGIFAVSSSLITGPTEAMLIDSQFSVKDGAQLAEMIRASGKKLKSVLITSGDPDFYFGLEPVVKAFPGIQIFATPEVVKHIKETQEAKLAYWGPQLKDGAPAKVIVPQQTTRTHFYVDGEEVEIRSPESHAAYVWVPSAKTILGGTGVSWGIHVWTADTRTSQSRDEWIKTLSEMKALAPARVIPGHYLGQLPHGAEAVTFTSEYLKAFNAAVKEQKNYAGVISTMEKKWPDLKGKSSLELSAKVNTGEMKW